MPEITLSSLTMHYEEQGQGHPLIVLPGFGLEHHETMGLFEPLFSQRDGWRRLYPEMPGTGQTPANHDFTSADQWLELIDAFVEALIPGEDFTVAGESYGAYLARGLLTRKAARVLGIAMIVPVIIPLRSLRTVEEFHVFETDLEFLDTLSPDDKIQLNDALVLQTPKTCTRFINEIMPGVTTSDWPFLNDLQRTAYAFSVDIDQVMSPCTVPTLFIAGRQDNVVGYKDIFPVLDKFPRATLVVIDRAGHSVSIEQESLVQALLHDWLDRVEQDLASNAP
ncbi:MAG TPA: alpha/beta hydrolase [Candidatus Lokiarchaeia archaeon]|nr:alpha/beta hydrolase [Candidatus Lokiarchaeia archaeon]